ncbi:MAG: 2'-5' RNA ligase family protein [Candidatus Saccharimonadales bacterium]
MMNLVLGYPNLSKADFDWIQGLRRAHDKLYGVVKPHFTLVFPTNKLPLDDFVKHIESKIVKRSKITIKLTQAIVVEDDSKTFYHTFLVPTEGKQDIIELHDLFYTEDLASELRQDIPFIPHVGIGTDTSKEEMQKLADYINTTSPNIEGSIEALTIVGFDGKHVNDIKQIELR